MVIAGIFFHLLAVRGAPIDSDEAVAGLLARHVMHGDFRVFFWGQSYGGTPDAFFLAPFVALRPGSVLAVRATALLVTPLISLVLWRILLRCTSRRTAAFAAAATYVFPAFAVEFSTRAELFYDPVVLLGALILLFGIRFKEQPLDWRNAVGWGLAAGIGWWLGPTIAFYVLASVAWLLWQSRISALWRALCLAVPSSVIGALPWIVSNLQSGLLSLKSQPRVGTYPEHARVFFQNGLPAIFGLRFIGSDVWLVPRTLGLLIFVLVTALLLWRMAVTALEGSPLAFAIIAGTVGIILIPLAFLTSNGRYMYYVSPFIIATLLTAISHRRLEVVVAVVVLLSTTSWYNRFGAFAPGVSRTVASIVSDSAGPVQTDQTIVKRLEAIGVTRMFADYWLSYKYDYLSDERIIITPFAIVRSAEYEKEVRTSTDPAYLFSQTSPRASWMEARLAHLGVAYTATVVENLIVIAPHRHTVPTDLLSDPRALLEAAPVSALPPP